MAKIGYRLRVTEGRTDVQTDGRMDRETCQLKYYFRFKIYLLIFQSN
jgi:hypothetical protein